MMVRHEDESVSYAMANYFPIISIQAGNQVTTQPEDLTLTFFNKSPQGKILNRFTVKTEISITAA